MSLIRNRVSCESLWRVKSFVGATWKLDKSHFFSSSQLPLAQAGNAAGEHHQPAEYLEHHPVEEHHALGLNFGDTENTFRHVSNMELLRSAAVMNATRISLVSEYGPKLFNFAQKIPLVRPIVNSATRKTFFAHFVGGEDILECQRRIQPLTDRNVVPILDYAVEFMEDATSDSQELKYDATADTVASTITQAEQVGLQSLSCVKLTGIARFGLLEKLNVALGPNVVERTDIDQALAEACKALTFEERKELERVEERLESLCAKAAQKNIPLLIDAEHFQVQNAIETLALAAIQRHNTPERAYVYNTVQTYLKSAHDRISRAVQHADATGIRTGIKFVRGAYISYERRHAVMKGQSSPVFDSIHDTHKCFDSSAAMSIELVGRGKLSTLLATHNEGSVVNACRKIVSEGLPREHPEIMFAQLFGMSENLTFTLSNSGFRAAKYVPFGPLLSVMPYLTRRLEENRDMLKGGRADAQKVASELKRRLNFV